MKLIELAVKRPVAVLSVVLMVVLMGWLALQIIPIQLTPDVRKPLLIIQTSWPGASPAEIEREIVIPQEEKLKGLEGLDRMESRSRRGRGQIILEFSVNTDRNRSILLVNNRLQQVTGSPEEADEPILRTRDTDDNPIAWFTVQTVPGNSRPIRSYGDYVDDTVRDRLERVDGVALVNIYGGNESEIRIIVDPRRLAHYRLTIAELNNALRGKIRRYRSRTTFGQTLIVRIRTRAIGMTRNLDNGLLVFTQHFAH